MRRRPWLRSQLFLVTPMPSCVDVHRSLSTKQRTRDRFHRGMFARPAEELVRYSWSRLKSRTNRGVFAGPLLEMDPKREDYVARRD